MNVPFNRSPWLASLFLGLLPLPGLAHEGASLPYGSRMQAAIDENAGACFLFCVEMTPLRAWVLPDVEGDLRLPPLEDGRPARDPFDAQLVSSVRRTPDGFELRIDTR